MKRSRSLRKRLAMLYLVVFGCIQMFICAVLVVAREISAYEDFDRFLLQRAEAIAESVELTARALPPGDEALPRLNPGRPRPGHWELRGADGGVIQKSDGLGDESLPWPAPRSRRGVEFYSTAQGAAAADLGPLRIVRVFQDVPGLAPFWVQVARETTTLQQSNMRLRRAVLTLVPIGLLLSAIAASVLARRSLKPIARVVAEAKAVTPADLSRRIPSSKAGDEVAELIDVLNGMLARLQTGFSAQERFTADVSHELKTPMIALAAEAHTLSRAGATDAERLAFLQRVSETGERLARTVESFLMLARAEAGFPIARPEPVFLSEALTDVVRICTPQALAGNVRLRAILPEPGPSGEEPAVLGDRDLLRSLLENLTRNAVMHTAADSSVVLELRYDDRRATILVTDRGPGIPQEQLENVFQRFCRLTLPGEWGPNNKGSGLGLAIATAIVRLHGGEISAERPPEGGFRMIVHLPLESRAKNKAAF